MLLPATSLGSSHHNGTTIKSLGEARLVWLTPIFSQAWAVCLITTLEECKGGEEQQVEEELKHLAAEDEGKEMETVGLLDFPDFFDPSELPGIPVGTSVSSGTSPCGTMPVQFGDGLEMAVEAATQHPTSRKCTGTPKETKRTA